MSISEPSSEQQPLVSVVIPAYKAERWIGETILSVQAQTYRNLEIIVVDDGSPDNLAEFVVEMAKNDGRIRLIQVENGGVSAARNTGIYAARGEYIAPVDADDLWYPEKIEKQIGRFRRAEIEKDPIGLVYCWSESIDEYGERTRPKLSKEFHEGDVFRELAHHNFTSNGSSAMMTKEAIEHAGYYPEHIRHGGEDWALYLRIAQDFRFGVVPEVQVGYRQLNSSLSRDLRHTIHCHRLAIEHQGGRAVEISEDYIRDSLHRTLTYHICRPGLFTSASWRAVWDVLQVDPLYPLRRRTWSFFCQNAYAKLCRNKTEG